MTSEMHGMFNSAMELLGYQAKHSLVDNSEAAQIAGENLGNWRSFQEQQQQQQRSTAPAWPPPSITVAASHPFALQRSEIQSQSRKFGVGVDIDETSQNPQILSEGKPTYLTNNARYPHHAYSSDASTSTGNVLAPHPTILGFEQPLPFSEVASSSAHFLRDQAAAAARWQTAQADAAAATGNINAAAYPQYNGVAVNWAGRLDGSGSGSGSGSSQRLALSLSSYRPSELHQIPSQGNLFHSLAESRTRNNDNSIFMGIDAFSGMSQASRETVPRNPSTAERAMFAGYSNSLKNSIYFKAAEELLCEFCNVGSKPEAGKRKGAITDYGVASSSKTGDSKSKKSAFADNPELFPGDRYELQRRKVKLVSMLEEVDIRYKSYRSQMEMVIASFESVTTVGSAAPYTALALKAMSRHFRCLRDAITGQLHATVRMLGEKDSVVPGTTRGETPRLGLIERTLRQQRAFQQLGAMEQQPWRPQRGLPERSVSILRAWLFEHFLHPYPTDGDKHILAKQTGLSRSQVSNWFINARVRLWKPMVEEMYLEELKEEKTEKADDDKADEQKKPLESSETIAEKTQLGASASITLNRLQSNQRFNNLQAPEMAIGAESDSTSSRGDITQVQISNNEQGLSSYRRPNTTTILQTPNNLQDFATYPAENLNRHYANNGVSLTLGLRHSGLSYPLSEPVKYSSSSIYQEAHDNQHHHRQQQFQLLENDEEEQRNGFIDQDLQYRHYGNRLLHDFVHS
eukprot:TRINITY_DN3779_c0_g1_i1.p1 TRINITY_DN3779_c0_g1~~TRINITY_DN3779_c0_g1_i1.p1  ORF type:complete len:744 (+),score=75.68 TRINITY_DN3779_c0_g1_i1:1451-3682(+)